MPSAKWHGHQQEWPAWSPGQWPKKKGQPKGNGKGEAPKKGAEVMAVARAYDSDGGATMSGPSAADGHMQDGGVQEFVKEILSASQALGRPLPEKLKGLLPNVDREEIKEQQKKLNKLRNVRNRIESKERALKQDEAQWDKWLREMRESIIAQKQKHEETQERLEKELMQLRRDEEELKNGKEEEEPEMELVQDPEELIATMLTGNGMDKELMKREAANMDKFKKDMEAKYQQQLEQDRARMTQEFQIMLQKTLQQNTNVPIDVEALADPTGPTTEEAEGATVAPPGLGEAAGKAALVPFGVARRMRSMTATSPYGRKDEEKSLDELKKEIEEKRDKEDSNGQDTGQS